MYIGLYRTSTYSKRPLTLSGDMTCMVDIAQDQPGDPSFQENGHRIVDSVALRSDCAVAQVDLELHCLCTYPVW